MIDETEDIVADTVEPDPELATVDLSNPKSVRRVRDKAKREMEEAALFWQAVFNDRVGRREMWNLLRAAHAFEERFACGPAGFPDHHATFFHAGEQALGMRLFLSWLKMAPEGVHQMLLDHDTRFAKPKRSTTERG